MTSKDYENFINETKNYPYFSALYDMESWKDDYAKVKADLEILEILEKHLSVIFYQNSDNIRIRLKDLTLNTSEEDFSKVLAWRNKRLNGGIYDPELC